MSTWLVPELDADFDYDFEDKIIEYIYNKWQSSDPAKDPSDPHPETGENICFRAGFPDFNVPYEVCCVQTRTVLLEKIDGKHAFSTGLDIMCRMKRLNRDAIDIEPQLENMENEVQRIVENYEPNEILGIKDLVYDENPSAQRVYNARDSFMKSDWRSIIRIKVFYQKDDTRV